MEDFDDTLRRIKNESLFELDIFDFHDAEGVIKSIEDGTDDAGGLYRLANMVNSSYEMNYFMSSGVQ